MSVSALAGKSGTTEIITFLFNAVYDYLG